MTSSTIHLPYHIMAKPAGAACNLQCEYCYYLEKSTLYPLVRLRMSDRTLEAYTRVHVQSHPKGQTVTFTWQGGEPTLLGIEFFERACALQRRFAGGRRIENTLQTNGTLLDEAWCTFLRKEHFLVGLSMDGPAFIHDHYRVDKAGDGTHQQVLNGFKLLKEHGVDVNVLSCVTRFATAHPQSVYEYFREIDATHVQFLAIVERVTGTPCSHIDTMLSRAPAIKPLAEGCDQSATTMSEASVIPREYGDFLCAVFDSWLARDVGRLFVLNFEWALAGYLGLSDVTCIHQRTCGQCVALEHNGDVYACDHFVYPEFLLGNIHRQSLDEMLLCGRQIDFGNLKFDALPSNCHSCAYLRACWGGCPKHRFVKVTASAFPQNYLCPGYKKFFSHIWPHLARLAARLNS